MSVRTASGCIWAKSIAHIDCVYGGVDAYLERELGVTAADVARLRTLYLE